LGMVQVCPSKVYVLEPWFPMQYAKVVTSLRGGAEWKVIRSVRHPSSLSWFEKVGWASK
jgi:hypothetical protein